MWVPGGNRWLRYLMRPRILKFRLPFFQNNHDESQSSSRWKVTSLERRVLYYLIEIYQSVDVLFSNAHKLCCRSKYGNRVRTYRCSGEVLEQLCIVFTPLCERNHWAPPWHVEKLRRNYRFSTSSQSKRAEPLWYNIYTLVFATIICTSVLFTTLPVKIYT